MEELVTAGSEKSANAGWLSRTLHAVATLFDVFIVLCIFIVYMLWGVPLVHRILLDSDNQATVLTAEEGAELTANLEKELDVVTKKYTLLTPKAPFLIINTTQNEYRLFDKRAEVKRGFCSTGSYTKLYNEKKTWVFKTPKGVRKVIGKVTNPVWIKPDWAFVEEGIPIPPKGHPSRYESGTLGDYALSLGDGYLIHGTLYQRFLGQSVTHGCVRMGDEDLEAVYKTLKIGSKVYIY
jgi:L,D-transpeptidase YbiS